MKNTYKFGCTSMIRLSWIASLWLMNYFQVFHPRSWVSARVMTASQRVELLKRVKDGTKKRLSFFECEKIAEDLNLTLEQVGYVVKH